MLRQEAQRSDTWQNFVVGFYDFTIILKCGNILNGNVHYYYCMYFFFATKYLEYYLNKYFKSF